MNNILNSRSNTSSRDENSNREQARRGAIRHRGLRWIAVVASLLVGAAVVPLSGSHVAVASGPTVATLVPGRLVDTRAGQPTIDGKQSGVGVIAAGGTLEVQVGGRHGIPGDAAAAMLNVTAVRPAAPGFLTVFPCGASRPTTSSVNYQTGQVVPNAVLTKIGQGGKVCIFSLAAANVIVDVTAYVPKGGGGGGDDGSTPGGPGGRTTIAALGFGEQAITSGPDGVMHLVFDERTENRLWYARCASNCGRLESWQSTVIAEYDLTNSVGIGFGGIGIDASGRVHVLIDGVGYVSSATTLTYATCASSCTNAANWDLLDLNSLESYYTPTTANAANALMVEPNGRLSFVADNLGSFYYSCATNCTSLANWSVSESVFDGYLVDSAIDASGVTHLLVEPYDRTDDGDIQLLYARCATACQKPSSWKFAQGAFLTYVNADRGRITATDSGRIVIGYPQGNIHVNDPNDDRYVVASCSGAACMNVSGWTRFAVGAKDEGTESSGLESYGESVVLATTDRYDSVFIRACDAGCGSAAAWSGANIADDVRFLEAEIPATSLMDCPGSAGWYPGKPVVAIGSKGLVLVHDPHALGQCNGSNNVKSLPAMGRIFSTF